MKFKELLERVPIESNILVSKNDNYYSNTEYCLDNGSFAELYSREDFIDNLGDHEVKFVYSSMFGYDDCILDVDIEDIPETKQV